MKRAVVNSHLIILYILVINTFFQVKNVDSKKVPDNPLCDGAIKENNEVVNIKSTKERI